MSELYLEQVSLEDQAILARLLELYLYDFSEFTERLGALEAPSDLGLCLCLIRPPGPARPLRATTAVP